MKNNHPASIPHHPHLKRKPHSGGRPSLFALQSLERSFHRSQHSCSSITHLPRIIASLICSSPIHTRNLLTGKAMFATIRSALISSVQRRLQGVFPPIAPSSLAEIPVDRGLDIGSFGQGVCDQSTLEDSLWFAVPKSKVSRGKKRMKTTLQKRIKLKDNIVIDKRTGELTLKHKLPYNWKNYLPENAEYAP
ncbi:hypothetical protein HJC23_003316 [Cyclotella cryptica]|uniref:Uncharacterized protein n=1 Tax=Cyclotella cryptica TaxID=29204 RepID=A0ABD3QXZ1_9STRA|eukprot:CCRYP_000861-RA/>CCRYP_000861-RA protein AED:0.00 eAED:0.00 QI:53/1/1/1/1/1/2/261/191